MSKIISAVIAGSLAFASTAFAQSFTPGGGAGTGTVTSSLAGQLAWYALSGTTIVGNPNITATNGTLWLGQSTSVIGKLTLFGNTTGAVTISPQAAAGTYNFNLPTTGGLSGQPLLSGGGGGAAMTYGSLSGNSSTFATTSGSLPSGNCAKFDASGNIIDAGGSCTGIPLGCATIEAFGGAGNNSTDNLTPWNNAVASFGSNDICILFGVGTYRFSAVTSATPSANIKVLGVGKNISHLQWINNTAGMTLNTGNEMAVEVDGLDFTTSIVNSNTALTINSSDCTGAKYSSHFHDLAFRGSGSYPSPFYWASELVLNTLSFVNVDEVDFYGDTGNHPNGLSFQSTNTPTCYALVLNVIKSNFINLAKGFIYGTYAQGVTIAKSNFTNGVSGISVPNTSINVAQMVVSDSQFNVAQDQIYIQGILLGGQFSHNTFSIPTVFTGIHIAAGTLYTITGNIFLSGGAQGLTGVQVDSNAAQNAGIVTGNSFNNIQFGVALAAGADHWSIQSNMYSANVANKTSNLGTNNLVGVASP